ncbi:hypothetical protein BJX65DRAFT_304556 [Aspergillus insuetus]
MPSHILGGPLPGPPAWGALPLDVYLLEQWDAPLPSPRSSSDEAASRALNSETPTERSKQLIRRFLCTGAGWKTEEEHAVLWEEDTYATFVNDEGFSFDDKELFENLTLTQALELFPERDLEDCNPAEALKPEQYGDYHAACVVTRVFVEDIHALETSDLLHVFLDDCGNVVREWRTGEGADDEFDGVWLERVWKEDISGRRGELGPAYQRGGCRGPPYARKSNR